MNAVRRAAPSFRRIAATELPAARRIPGLDGLRAVAALAVFGVHFNQTTRLDIPHVGFLDISRLLDNGNSGVALFFALSGFLLGLPFWSAASRGAAFPSWGVYTVRRLLRIVPAYYLCLTALVVANGLWRKGHYFEDLILHYTFLYNFSDTSFYGINPPFWTIGIEMQFYVILPLVFLLVWRLPSTLAMIAIVSIGVAAYGVQYWLMRGVSAPGPSLSHSALAHLPHFLIGVVAGWFYRRRRDGRMAASLPARLRNDAVFWGAAALIVLILGTGLDGIVQLPFGRYNLPVVPFLIAAMIVSAPASLIARLCLDGIPLRFLGVISYGIYLYHLPVMNASARALTKIGLGPGEHWMIFAVVSLSLTVAVAAVSYGAFERPILRWVHRKRRVPIAREA